MGAPPRRAQETPTPRNSRAQRRICRVPKRAAAMHLPIPRLKIRQIALIMITRIRGVSRSLRFKPPAAGVLTFHPTRPHSRVVALLHLRALKSGIFCFVCIRIRMHARARLWQVALLSWQAALLSWQAALLSWQVALLSWQVVLPSWQVALPSWQVALPSWQVALLSCNLISNLDGMP